MNSINNGWDSTERAETPYFHCGPSSQNENERKGKRENKKQNKKNNNNIKQYKKNTDIYAYVYIHKPTDIQTYINTDTNIHINPLCVVKVR